MDWNVIDVASSKNRRPFTRAKDLNVQMMKNLEIINMTRNIVNTVISSKSDTSRLSAATPKREKIELIAARQFPNQ